MSRQSRNLFAGGSIAGLLIVLTLATALLRGRDVPSLRPDDRLVVHEWGTFTNFSGSDGVNLEFRPTTTSDLPNFVHTPMSRLGLTFSKQARARQRMETPVTYFYTDVPRKVRVRVGFPQGLLTEWYPPAKYYDPGRRNADQAIVGEAYLDWGTVRLTPQDEFKKVRVNDNEGRPVPARLPFVDDGDHYGQARATDSAIVETSDIQGNCHFEKFLFYRGLGNFNLPVRLTALGQNRFEVTNAAGGASGAMLLVRIEDGRVRFVRQSALEAQETVELSLPAEESTVDALAEATVVELVSAGLYRKEAVAMVETWRTSWFGEDGTRLLYLVPQLMTDAVLPLDVFPVPDEQVRVLVGRLETLTPEDCRELIEAVAGEGDKLPDPQIAAARLIALGRFAEPALQFALTQTTDEQAKTRLESALAKVKQE